MKKLLLTTLFVLASANVNAASVNLVTNGSFENPNIAAGSWHVYNSINGWNTIGAGVEVRDNVAGKAYKGTQFVELDSHGARDTNSAIYQSFSNTVAGQMYQISFAYSPRIRKAADTNGISVFWNGVEKKSVTGQGGNKNLWEVFTINVLGEGQDELKFLAVGKDDSVGGNLDAISLSEVPVPTAALLFAPALMGLMGLRRKSKKAVA